jgi:hypothetical protein
MKPLRKIRERVLDVVRQVCDELAVTIIKVVLSTFKPLEVSGSFCYPLAIVAV